MTTVNLICARHPNYKAKRKPVCDCIACNDIWHLVNNGGFVFYGVHEIMPRSQWDQLSPKEQRLRNIFEF